MRTRSRRTILLSAARVLTLCVAAHATGADAAGALRVPVARLPSVSLQSLPAVPDFTARSWGATADCGMGYVTGHAPVPAAAAALPADGGGVLYTPADLSTWRSRVQTGPFLVANDYTAGSPGDWSRITANADRFVDVGEVVLTPANQAAQRASHGTLVRDAAFVMLIGGDTGRYLAKIRDHLLLNLEAPVNDYTLPCWRHLDGKPATDVMYIGAGWMMKLFAAYDFVRPALPAADRLRIERAIMKQAHAFATHLDESLRSNFPQRLAGSYASMAADAARKGDSRWYPKPVDLNGNCSIDADETAAPLPAYAYVRADGSLGPRLSYLTQWYNNRRGNEAAAVGIAAGLLDHKQLAERSKRYFFEWVTYGMAPDGSDGEFVRNGNYCIPKQGLIYHHGNLQGALLAARALARRADRDLYAFATKGGLNGTEVTWGGAPKSLATGVRMHLDLAQKTLPWYLHEPQFATQSPRDATHLGRMEGRYMNSAKENDNFHELGLLLSAHEFPTLPVAQVMLRDGLPAALRFPGSNGNAVWTGTGTWSDPAAVMPGVYLLRP